MARTTGLPAGPDARSAPGRDLFLDVVRCCALAAVVFNHYTYSYYRWNPNGGFHRMIQEMGHAWVTWPFVWELPAFFFVGGAVIVKSAATMPYGAFVSKRVWRLLLPTAACLLTGGIVEAIANGLGTPACHPGSGPLMGVIPMYLSCVGSFWIGPLWFMMVFVPLTILSPLLVRLYRGRNRFVMLGVIVAAVAASDVGQFAGGGALPTSELSWVVPWLLGFSYADGSLQRLGRKRLVAWGLVAGAVMIAGIALGPWSSVLGRFPRSLETVMEGVVAVPLLVAFREPIARWGERGVVAKLVDVIGPRMMSIYVWHQPALAVVVAVCAALQLDLAPEVGGLWLLQKIPWVIACLLVLRAILWLMEPVERIPPPKWLMPTTRPAAAP